jgi:hypothetical protein
MSQTPDPIPPNPIPPRPAPRSLAGTIALVVLGLVILIPSGLCTAAMGIASLGSMFSNFGGISSAISGLVMTIVLGGPFVALGAFLIWTGMRGRWPK